ncbi:sigma factor-like helix-turn-helix DNA-binding protein [Bradyrhizobium elkanii]|nr:hypothetical protein A6X20_24765 [Bradyrhizobium elkanii]ODM81514.1 hypothetical protein A6452_22540 [Bradyrhizobium elkanii]
MVSERKHRGVEARLLSDEPKTLDEPAQERGVSRERIRQIEARAVELIRARSKPVPPKPKLRPALEPRRHALEQWSHLCILISTS